ncbi:MAG: hypothetical protein JWO37_1813 [Acidimicrobiales bacterium]|nr:hypothetical protein [Acidimicrobiales bacterium]
MRRLRTVRILVIIGMALGAFAGPQLLGAPARADCVYAEASYELLSPTDHWVLGPKQCVAPTPWPICGGSGPTRAGLPGVALVETQVWVPCPI